MSWVLYTLVLSVLLTAAALGLERVLVALRLPTRWLWLGAMAATCALAPLAWSGALTPETVEVAPTALPLSPAAPASAAVEGSVQPEGFGSLLSVLNPAGAPARALNRTLGRADEALAGGLAAVGLGTPSGSAAARMGAYAAWAAGSLALLWVLLMSWRRLARWRRAWPRADIQGHRVRVSEALGPAVVGVRRPEIVLPTHTLRLDSSRLGLILLHEREHLSAGDTRMLAAGLVPLVLMPWNPLLWWQSARLREAVEVDCDARVLRTGIPPRHYAGTLLDVGGDRFPGLSPSPALGGPARRLERRIRTMRHRSPLKRAPVALLGALLAIGLLMMACEIDPPAGPERAGNEAAAADAPRVVGPAVLTDVRIAPVQVYGEPGPDGESRPAGWMAALRQDDGSLVTGIFRGPLGLLEGITDGTLILDSDSDRFVRLDDPEGAALLPRTHLLETDGPGDGTDERKPAMVEMIEVGPEEVPPPPSDEALELREIGPADVGTLEIAPPRSDDATREMETLERLELLQGQISGARVRTRGGAAPGEGPSVRLRSRTNMSSSGPQPLIIVDGIIQTSSTIDMDSEEIAHIEVVRGSAASEEYGTRAAGGVILITTHR